jgi:NAD(P)-dependent dehydrogenase (short-subunit alcohol dehydrogenase family)
MLLVYNITKPYLSLSIFSLKGGINMNDIFNLQNKTAIVTGGGRGLGEQMAYALAEAGAKVVICSRNLEACQRVQKNIIDNGGSCLSYQCDVTQEQDIISVINETVKKFGSLDILINNSGTSWLAPTLEHPADKWDKVMNVNLRGSFLFAQAAAKVMVEQGYGKIINITSITGFRGTDPAFLDTIAYTTSKGALITLTKELAVKLAPYNIQVNALAPGLFPTKITKTLEKGQKGILMKIPARRFGTGEDLKGATVFLSSSASDYITGQILAIDGGLSSGI